MRYLVTGAQGFTGRFLVAEILARDPAAIVFGTGRSAETRVFFTHDVSWRGRSVRAPLTEPLRSIDRERYTYMPCALERGPALGALVALANPDAVIHLASALRDDAAQTLIHSNIAGTAALMSALETLPRKPLLVIGSSGSVYGKPQYLPLAEDHPCSPFEPYAMSKLAAEYVARIASGDGGVPTIWARIFNIAGPGQEERHVCGRFAAQLAAIVVEHQVPVIEVGDLRPKRDFIDVRDVARALVTLVEHGVPGETYNVASGTEIAIGDILSHTIRLANFNATIALEERYGRASDLPRAYADIDKLRARGFTPAFPIERTIADLLAYYLVDVAATAETRAVISATSASEIERPSSHG